MAKPESRAWAAGALLMLGSLMTASGTARAEPGDLSGFDFTRDSGSSEEDPVDVVVGASGKIYVLNRLGGLTDFDYRIQRFNADGTVDSAFGDNGHLSLPVSANLFSDAEALFSLAVDEAKSKLVVGGVQIDGVTFLGNPVDPKLVAKRIHFAGGIDTSFGDQGRALINAPQQGGGGPNGDRRQWPRHPCRSQRDPRPA